MSTHYFDPRKYIEKIKQACTFIKERLPKGFKPQIALTLGSGGLGEVANLIENAATLNYCEIPGFKQTTVEGHSGNLIIGYIERVPVIALQGRYHYYEEGDQPNQVIALKNATFPVYVVTGLGVNLYFATNAAGGLNTKYKPGDLMIIESHIDIFFPNPLLGPHVDFRDAPRFQPQHTEYSPKLCQLLRKAAENTGETKHVHKGVYVALTGPTYETKADSKLLRNLGADAVGMSTVPEIIVATNLGVETCGLSLITNVIAEDGTNATSHQEVMAALQNENTKERVKKIIQEFFKLYYKKKESGSDLKKLKQ